MSMANLIPSSTLRSAGSERPWTPVTTSLVVGTDILELLSSAMYVDPMSIYREYVQNAADAIDDARENGVISAGDDGHVDFFIDAERRTVKIRDNGSGLAESEFVHRLTAFGASAKRGRHARGFRGVGRLGGIGYCQELIFRTRTKGDDGVNELRWDCKKLKALLRAGNPDRSLSEMVKQAVDLRRIDAADWPDHFFEVELSGIIRHRNDRLLDPCAIDAYLSQVAPVPFSPEFRYAGQITEVLGPFVKLGDLQIRISGLHDPVYRPHRDRVALGPGVSDEFKDLQLLTIPAVDEGTAAVGWVLHHGYAGALPASTGVRGLRARVGNLQVGDDRLMEELFVEARFNSWVVGEIHVLDERVFPNGRRDHFEQSVHYQNLLTHVTPVVRDLTRHCRISSIRRNRSREFLRQVEAARERLSIIKQRAIARAEQGRLLREVHALIVELEKLAATELVLQPKGINPAKEIQKLRREATRADGAKNTPSTLAHLPKMRRQAYERVFSLLYECAPNRAVAKSLIDRIMTRLS